MTDGETAKTARRKTADTSAASTATAPARPKARGKPFVLARRAGGLARRRFVGAGRSSTAPAAARTAAPTKRRSVRTVVRLRRFGRRRALPVLARSVKRAALRLHPHAIAGDYRRLLLLLHRLFSDRRAEPRFFVPTRGHIDLVRLSIPSQVRASGHAYRPTPCAVFHWAMAALPDTLDHTAFVDFGAGRGRALLLASHYPFERIIGAEIARELYDDCCMNIAQYPRPLMKCREVECHHRRATTLPIPEQASVFYFFDPFDRDVFEKVLARITRSYKRNRREMHLICVDMDEAEIVAAQGIFEPVAFPLSRRAKIAAFSPYPVRVYRTLP